MNRILGQRVLVTGATGFVGQFLVNGLLADGAEVVSVSRSSKVLSGHKTLQADLLKDGLSHLFADKIDVVYHLAAVTHDTSQKLSSEIYFDLNVKSTYKLAKQAEKLGVKKFIYLSSVKALGNGASKSSLPDGVYGQSKREAELKLFELGKKSGMQISIVRPSLIYGPGVAGNLGSMLKGIRRRWFPPLPNFKNERSMVHVDDLVKLLLILGYAETTAFQEFTITDGRKYSSSVIYDTLRKSLGYPPIGFRVPKQIFFTLCKLSPTIRFRLDKIISSQSYDDQGLDRIGFRPSLVLEDINYSEFVN